MALSLTGRIMWRTCHLGSTISNGISEASSISLLLPKVVSLAFKSPLFPNSSSELAARTHQQPLYHGGIIFFFQSHENQQGEKRNQLGFQTALCSHLESKKGSFNLTQPHFSNTWFFTGILLKKKNSYGKTRIKSQLLFNCSAERGVRDPRCLCVQTLQRQTFSN